MTSDTSSSVADTKTNVLVIDDSAIARQAITEVLKKRGYVVHELPSAIGATRVITRKKVRAVVIDLNMPELSGDKLVSLLRRNTRFDHIALILVSGDPNCTEELRGIPGVDDALDKRDVPNLLAPLLFRHIQRKREA